MTKEELIETLKFIYGGDKTEREIKKEANELWKNNRKYPLMWLRIIEVYQGRRQLQEEFDTAS